MKQINGLGARTMKTALAIFICIAISNGLNKIGVESVGFYAAISVIFTMQNTLEMTKSVGTQRILGTIVGGLVTIIAFSIQSELTGGNLDAFFAAITIIITFTLCINLKIPLGIPTAGIIVVSGFTMLPSDELFFFMGLRVAETIFGVVLAMVINHLVFAPKTINLGE
jgi:uncharacterized membrane protein YgaE (UPF0421/DUF939 family)